MIQFHRTPSFIKAWYPSLIWESDSDNTLYITFDDGPHPEITPWVISELEKHKAKGTFFCVGDNLKNYPDIAQLLVDEGHKLGNHTFNHLKGWETNDEEYLKNVKLCDAEISKFDRSDRKIFRPPYGRIKKSQASLLNEEYDIFMWSHLSWDFSKKLNVKKSIRKLKKVKPGSIIVFHDSPKSIENLKCILPEVLDFYSKKGFELKALL